MSTGSPDSLLPDGETLEELSNSPRATFDVEKIRAEFPVLDQRVNGHPLIYLDNAATTQKPRSVIEAIGSYYSNNNANVHRGVHELSQRATVDFEQSREKVRNLIGASSIEEIIFVRGATEGINLVAQTFGRTRVRAGDEILITTMEHHSNIVPWQMLCEQVGAKLKVVPINDRGEISLDEYESLLGEKTRLVAAAHLSNALGTINPVHEMVRLAHEKDIPVLLDSAQGTSHLEVDVKDIDCDFLVLSGHKMYGPTGIGALYGKKEHLSAMPPYQGGGDMILSVTFEKTTYNELPHKFEAGTPNIAGAIGLGAAIDFLESCGVKALMEHEHEVLVYGEEALRNLPEVRLIGEAKEKSSVLSFVVAGVHPHDLGTILDHQGIAIRTGHHCAQPTMERFQVPATARASIACFNTKQDIDALIRGIKSAIEVFT